jgi:magnesium chelatase accessory protein
MKRLDFKRDGADWPLREASRFVEAGGLNWHVQELGDGPKALLIHGTAGATHSWRGLAPLLGKDFRILAPDLPGHGFTSSRRPLDLSLPGMARALTALLATLDFAPRLAIGHSAGAAILARLIAEGRIRPDLFVSVNGAFLPFDGLAARLFPAVARLPGLNPMAARLFAATSGRATVANMLAGMGARLDPRGLDLYTRLMKNPAHCAGALDMMANWDLSSLPAELGRIDCSTLLIVGGNDGAVPPDDAFKVGRLLRRAEIDRLSGLGHLAHEEAPGRVAPLILAAAVRAGLTASAD